MDKPTLEALTQFCVDQHLNFDSQAWHNSDHIDRRRFAVVARYLSMTSWYGLETELEAIAEVLLPGISARHRFNSELPALAIDISYLSATVRYRIAMRRIAESSVSGFGTLASNLQRGQKAQPDPHLVTCRQCGHAMMGHD